ncbi:hypothetical protein C0J52_25814 [Blattella germanica]|nr:hypothetical protein C0J52_25814 [Blattella germanica]
MHIPLNLCLLFTIITFNNNTMFSVMFDHINVNNCPQRKLLCSERLRWILKLVSLVVGNDIGLYLNRDTDAARTPSG